MNPNRKRLLAAIVAAIAAIGITVTVTDTGPGTPRTVVVHLGKPALASPTIPNTITVPAAAVNAAANGLDDHAGSRDESPAGVPANQIDAGQQLQDTLAHQDQLPIVAPDAAPEQAGCRSRFITSFSSRRGVAPHVIIIHLTVSPNVPGWSDVDGVTAFFARTATQASSNYVEDGEGHCNYIVREVDKAWAQAAFNPYAISIEVINTGHEAVFIQSAGFRQLTRVVHDAAHRWGIPLQVAAIHDCVPTRFGLATHQMLGQCGGGHVDICPYDGEPCSAGSGGQGGPHTILNRLIRAARALDKPACNAHCREARQVRAKHQRTHQRLVKNHCRRGEGGYCKTLRDRNAQVHQQARRDRISLTGTYR